MTRCRPEGAVRAAQAGNTRMPVWLCKQLLGHEDTSKVEQTGPDGAAIKHAVHVMLSESEREQRRPPGIVTRYVLVDAAVGRRFASIAAECAEPEEDTYDRFGRWARGRFGD